MKDRYGMSYTSKMCHILNVMVEKSGIRINRAGDRATFVKGEGYDDFIIEIIHPGHAKVGHSYFTKRGLQIFDPQIKFWIHEHKGKVIWVPYSFRNSLVNRQYVDFDKKGLKPIKADMRNQNDIGNSFCSMWANNLEWQEYLDIKPEFINVQLAKEVLS